MEKEWLRQNNYQRGLFWYRIAVVVFIISIIILFFASLCVGRYKISIDNVIGVLFKKDVDKTALNVINNLRIPRTLLAVLVGAALSLSGAIYQGIFNNKIVSPDLLGVSSGAGVGACIGILIGLPKTSIIGYSFVAGFVSVLLSLLISKLIGSGSNIALLLSGVAVGGLMSSLIGLMKYLADDDSQLAEMTYWLLGSLANATMSDVFCMFPIMLICAVIALILANQIDAVSMGEREAKSLGVNYKAIILILILCSTLMTATAVSLSGVIGWVGLSLPNIVRLAFGNSHRKVLSLSLLLGIIFVVAADMLARTLSPDEIPLSIITGIIGTPLFLLSIYVKRKGV